MKDKIILIKGTEEAKAVQEKLFAKGCTWGGGFNINDGPVQCSVYKD